jgi:aldose 1-epimerase
MQVVNALIKANKDFELVVLPGVRHTMGGSYGEHKRYDFFVRHLLNVNPPNGRNWTNHLTIYPMNKKLLTGCGFLLFMFLFCACTQTPSSSVSGLYPDNFKAEKDGQKTGLYILKNSQGMEVCVTNFGGRVVSLMVPDKEGTPLDVVLGFDNVTDYMNIPTDFGASIGRYANRIANGSFTLDSTVYDLPKNNFGHCLHGGPNGWQYKIYEVEKATDSSIILVLHSPDGDESFPGNLTARVSYNLTEDNALEIGYEATTDKPTVINMTNHSYFNLTGNPVNNILGHVL